MSCHQRTAYGDDVFVGPVGVRGDKLIADVSYSGGCGVHRFRLSWDGEILKSNPPQVVFKLSHDGDDPCEAIISEQLIFDLSELNGLPSEPYVVVVDRSTGGRVLVE